MILLNQQTPTDSSTYLHLIIFQKYNYAIVSLQITIVHFSSHWNVLTFINYSIMDNCYIESAIFNNLSIWC